MRSEDKFKAQYISRAPKVSDLALISDGHQIIFRNTDNDVVRKRLAKVMVRDCFRNTKLEDYHAGTFSSSKTGDYSDVKVISPFGEIAWIKLSRLSDEEMKTVMIDIVNQCYKFLLELFLTGRGDDLINMLKERVLLATWRDPGASEPSTAGDG